MTEISPTPNKRNKSAEYNRAYYLRHKEAVQARKKARRDNDAALRQVQADRQRARRRSEKWRRGPVDVMMVTLSDGREVQANMLSPKTLATYLNVKLSRIYVRLARGLIPPNLYVFQNGGRAYTEHQAAVLRSVLEPVLPGNVYDDHMRAIHEKWALLDNGIDPSLLSQETTDGTEAAG